MVFTGCRFSSANICTFTLVWQRAKVPIFMHAQIGTKTSWKYQNPPESLKYQNIGCIGSDFCADFAIFQHFSRSTWIICRKRAKISENAKIIRTKFRKFSENEQNPGYFDILAVFYTLIRWMIFVLSFWNFRKSAASLSLHASVSLSVIIHVFELLRCVMRQSCSDFSCFSFYPYRVSFADVQQIWNRCWNKLGLESAFPCTFCCSSSAYNFCGSDRDAPIGADMPCIPFFLSSVASNWTVLGLFAF